MAYYTITIQPGILMTAEEFIRLPREDGWHYELAEGRPVWIIWPQAKEVEVWQQGSDSLTAVLNINDSLDGLDVVPGFTCPLARLFR
jgi:hypothetical protein